MARRETLVRHARVGSCCAAMAVVEVCEGKGVLTAQEGIEAAEGAGHG